MSSPTDDAAFQARPGDDPVDPAGLALLGRMRVATGIDVHPFVEGRPLVLAGVVVPHDRGLDGHSDADVVAHAVTDAVLGVAGMGDIGTLFPSEDASLEGADSMDLLAQALVQVREGGVTIVSIDAVLVAQEPRMGPHREAMEESLANTLGIDLDRVAVRATTTDHLGFVGRREGIACLATAVGLRG